MRPLHKVRLFPLREDAKLANDECVDLIPGEKFDYIDHMTAVRCLYLKEDALPLQLQF
jgi:hypothetical protein